MPVNIKKFTLRELETWVQSLGEPKYRGRQIFLWLYGKGVSDFTQMTDLPKTFRETLTKSAEAPELQIAAQAKDSDGTEKLKLRLPDGNFVETVIMPTKGGKSVCVSSQVGCLLGCKFCFTATLGFTRNLEGWEIVEQLRIAKQIIESNGSKLKTVVFMGMGEPLLNLDAVKHAVSIMSHKLGYNLSWRRISISTAGIIPSLSEVAKLPVSLALSLNATEQKQRERIMPIAKKYPLKQLLSEIDKLPLQKRKHMLIEYVLLPGFNDSELDIVRLGRIARRIGGRVNIIPFNPFPESRFKRPTPEQLDAFAAQLRYQEGVMVTVRESKGLGIFAACGTLAGVEPKAL